MPRIPFLALLVLAPVGCVSPPPVGPFVEYRDGQTPTTRTVKCEADYALVAHDPSATGGTTSAGAGCSASGARPTAR